jgi:hypothetical protein
MLGASSFEGQKFHRSTSARFSTIPEPVRSPPSSRIQAGGFEAHRHPQRRAFDRGKVQGPAKLHDPVEPLHSSRLPRPAERPDADKATRTVTDRIGIRELKLTPVKPAGFGTPHGVRHRGQPHRRPPVRALDRYNFSIKDGRLVLGSAYSVDYVKGEGKSARIKKYPLHMPGQHVAGPEFWLFPIPEIRA